jgi:hypothetical protein
MAIHVTRNASGRRPDGEPGGSLAEAIGQGRKAWTVGVQVLRASLCSSVRTHTMPDDLR